MKFIRYFLMYWTDYPFFKAFWTPERIQHLVEQSAEDAKFLEKNRFQYAWELARIQWAHRDRYSRRCTGDCENCKLKHC